MVDDARIPIGQAMPREGCEGEEHDSFLDECESPPEAQEDAQPVEANGLGPQETQEDSAKIALSPPRKVEKKEIPHAWKQKLKGAILEVARLPGARIALTIAGLMGAFAITSMIAEPVATLQEKEASVDEAGGFPTLDFRMADRTSVTERDVANLLARFQPETANAELPAASNGEARPPSMESERLYTAAEVAAAIRAAHQLNRAQQGHQPSPHGTALLPQSEPVSHPVGVEVSRPASVEHRTNRNRGRRRSASRKGKHDEYAAFLFGGPQFVSSGKNGTEREQSVLAVATRIPAVLDIGISSARHGTVLAKTTAEVSTLDGRRIPKGAILTGHSSSSGERIYIEVTKIQFGGKSVPVKATALTGTEAGIPAAKIEQSLQERTSSRVSQGALGALRGLTNATGTMGQIVGGAADGALQEASQEYEIDRTVVLHVPAGTQFIVVITG